MVAYPQANLRRGISKSISRWSSDGRRFQSSGNHIFKSTHRFRDSTTQRHTGLAL